MTQKEDAIFVQDITATAPDQSTRLGIGVVDSGKVIERWKLWMNHVVVMM